MPRSQRKTTKSKPRKSKSTDEEGWFIIKSVLEERTVNGRTEYLVDWENSSSGRSYTPTWSDDITELAKQDWLRRRKQRGQAEHSNPTDQNTQSNQNNPVGQETQRGQTGAEIQGAQAQLSILTSVEESQDSQPPRPAVSRRRKPSTVDVNDRPRKTSRIVYSQSSSEEPVPSVASLTFAETPVETPTESVDCLEQSERDPARNASCYLIVDIQPEGPFNPADYLSVADTQSSSYNSQALGDVDNETGGIAIPIDSAQPNSKFIPDSQESSNQSWFRSQARIAQEALALETLPDPERPLCQAQSIGDNFTQQQIVQQTSLTDRAFPEPREPVHTESSQQPPPKEGPSRTPPSAHPLIEPSEPPITEHPSEGQTCHESRPQQQHSSFAVAPASLHDPQPHTNSHTERQESTRSNSDSDSLEARGSHLVDAHAQQQGKPQETEVSPSTPPADIPSHQPENRAGDIELGIQVEDVACTDPSASVSNSVTREKSPTRLDQSAEESNPTFHTQQSLQPTFYIPSSSLSQILASPYTTLLEGRVSPVATGRSDSGSSGARVVVSSSTSEHTAATWQAAQVVDYTPPYYAKLSRSNSNHHNSASISEKPCPIHNMEGSDSRPSRSPQEGANSGTDDARSPPIQRVPAVNEVGVIFGTRGHEATEPATAANLPSQESAFEEGASIPSISTAANIPLEGVVTTTLRFEDFPADSSVATAPPATQKSATETLQDVVDAAFGSLDIPVSVTVPADSTVSLADIVNRSEMPLIAASGEIIEANNHSVSPSSVRSQDNELEHMVTLPFHAGQREPYDKILMDSKSAIMEFGNIFSRESYEEPSSTLVTKIDNLFDRLYNICDYPPDAVGTALEGLPAVQLAKYACDANPKFSFLHELLLRMQAKNTLVVVRSTHLIQLVAYVAENLGLEYVCNAIDKDRPDANSTAHITLILDHEDADICEFDVVIAFDHSYYRSPVAKKAFEVSQQTPLAKLPMILQLVTTHSIEHIFLHLPDGLSSLERKNALLSGIVSARRLVQDPDQVYPEPQELAEIFADYLNDKSHINPYEPTLLPDDILDVFASTQDVLQLPIISGSGQKRKLGEDDDDDDDDGPKRIRIELAEKSSDAAEDPPLPDHVRALLDNAVPTTTPTLVRVQVPLTVLEHLAEKHSEYQRQIESLDIEPEYRAVISRLESEIKENKRTNDKVYQAHRKAMEDSSRFRAEKRVAEKALQAVTEQRQREGEKTQKRIADLEATNSRLLQEGSELSNTMALLSEAQDRVRVLEKKVESSQQETDYIRNLFQDTRTTASTAEAENKELRSQLSQLEQRASDNIVKVHEIQSQTTTKEHLRMIRELQSQVKERELELDHVREELRQTKNGRRETRQASLPRSPRMGLMSPRPRIYGGPGSRATSPVPAPGSDPAAGVTLPGVQFLTQQTGNPRWNHLQ